MKDIIIARDIFSREDLYKQIQVVVEKYKIRLTPSEYKELEKMYIKNFVEQIDADALIKIAEDLKIIGD